MNRKFFSLVVASLLLAMSPAQAALVLTTTGTDTLASNFNPNYPGFPGTFPGFPGAVNPGSSTVEVIANPGEGLELTAPGTVMVEYLGRESAFTNDFRSPTFAIGDTIFSTATSSIGDTDLIAAGMGLVPFFFVSSGGGMIGNGNVPTGAMSIEFADLGDGSFLAFFNDPALIDNDFDDMVVRFSDVSQVPLPPAIWLLLSAILGLIAVARNRRSSTRTA